MVRRILGSLNRIVTILAISAGPVLAEAETEAELLARLQDPETDSWEAVEDRLADLWSRSGSPAMDLLLERGRRALEDREYDAAIEHLTALTDHAPDFAEGWNARATAYFVTKRYGPSISDIQRALVLNPNHFGALLGLAVMLDEIGYDEDALEAFRAAYALNPHRPEIKKGLDKLEREVGGQDL